MYKSAFISFLALNALFFAQSIFSSKVKGISKIPESTFKDTTLISCHLKYTHFSIHSSIALIFGNAVVQTTIFIYF